MSDRTAERASWQQQLKWLGYGLLLIAIGIGVAELLGDDVGWFQKVAAVCMPAYVLGAVVHALFKGAREESHKKGHDEGHADGYAEGHDEGYDEGFKVGKAEGHEEGCDEGFKAGRAAGYDEGYDEGFKAGEAEAEDEWPE